MFLLACRIATHLLDGDSLLLLVGGLESLPSFFRRDVSHNTVKGEQAVGVAVSSDVALGLADTTGLRSLVRAVSLAMSRLATTTTLAGKLALDSLIRAVGSVVTRLVAVVAQSGVEALRLGFGAVASEVAVGVAAKKNRVSRMSKKLRTGLNSLETAATVVTSVLGDVLANVASVVLETVTARGGRRRSPGLVGRETAVTGGRCKECQL